MKPSSLGSVIWAKQSGCTTEGSVSVGPESPGGVRAGSAPGGPIGVKRINGGMRWPFVIRGHKPSIGHPSPFRERGLGVRARLSLSRTLKSGRCCGCTRGRIRRANAVPSPQPSPRGRGWSTPVLPAQFRRLTPMAWTGRLAVRRKNSVRSRKSGEFLPCSRGKGPGGRQAAREAALPQPPARGRALLRAELAVGQISTWVQSQFPAGSVEVLYADGNAVLLARRR